MEKVKLVVGVGIVLRLGCCIVFPAVSFEVELSLLSRAFNYTAFIPCKSPSFIVRFFDLIDAVLLYHLAS